MMRSRRVDGSDVYAYTGARPLDAALPTVVFVHGAANDHSVWALQSRYFAHHGWNVLAVDLPGHGRSGGGALPSVEAIADWIPAVLDAARIDQAALVGHSLGSLAVARVRGATPRARSQGRAGRPRGADAGLAKRCWTPRSANDHVAFELITGWSYSAGKQLGGNQVPGVWLTGSALRLMERTRPGVLHADLARLSCACDRASTARPGSAVRRS